MLRTCLHFIKFSESTVNEDNRSLCAELSLGLSLMNVRQTERRPLEVAECIPSQRKFILNFIEAFYCLNDSAF